ncbi:MAG: RNA polymerase sigma factor [Gemmataceae bacterium]
MALTPVDRDLLHRCLQKQPGSWNDFVDRFLSLIYHTIHYTAHSRSARVNPEDVEDIAAEVLYQIVANDYQVLRQFQGNASLATYLTVIARRTCVHELSRRQGVKESIRKGDMKPVAVNDDSEETDSLAAAKGIERLEEVEKLLRKLPAGREREIVRLYYLEMRTYEEISIETGVPVNSIGSVLSRARKKLREYRKSTTDLPALKRMLKDGK